jgi:hypothetical protein
MEKYRCIKEFSKSKMHTSTGMSSFLLEQDYVLDKPKLEDIIIASGYEAFSLDGSYICYLTEEQVDEYFINYTQLRENKINQILK